MGVKRYRERYFETSTLLSDNFALKDVITFFYAALSRLVKLSLFLDIEPIFCDYANYCQFGAMCTSNSQIFPAYNYDAYSLMPRQTKMQTSLCTCGHYRCSEKWYKEPICGDDGVTYPGDCFLNQAACIQQSPKHKLHSGSCKTPNQG